MERLDLIQRIRSMTRDFTKTAFREQDLRVYLNESIDRIRQLIPEMQGMGYLLNDSDVPTHVPDMYHHLLAVYASSRCFAQDERHYQAGNLMNEFEAKISDLKTKIENGEIVITDPETGEPIHADFDNDYVVNNYFWMRSGNDHFD